MLPTAEYSFLPIFISFSMAVTFVKLKIITKQVTINQPSYTDDFLIYSINVQITS